MHALIDADILNYRIGFATNNESEGVAIKTMAGFLEDLLLFDLPDVWTWELHLTGKNNFRNNYAQTVPYKGNRTSDKPIHYHVLRTYLKEEWQATINEGIEADDMLAIRQTELGDSSIIVTLDKDRLADVKQRLEKAVADLKVQLDENRFEQELVYYLEKYDITEEKVRLKNHLDYFTEALDSEDSNGKKLGFIAQEIGREINTIGSKSNYAPMQQLVVQMKDELEKIKEQVLNVL